MRTFTEKGGLTSMISCKHSIYNNEVSQPHSGDLIWSLACIKELQTPVTYYLDCETEELYSQLKPITDRQEYIHETISYTDQQIDYDLDKDVRRTNLNQCLCDVFTLSADHNNNWLATSGSDEGYDILYRNTRYRNDDFDWKKFVKDNIKLSNCVFVGKYHEYVSFILTASILPRDLKWIETRNVNELYDVIANCRSFYGNGGLPYVLACGMGKPCTCEIEPAPYTGVPIMHNVLNRPTNTYYTHYNDDKICTLPSLYTIKQ
jgi:hypothetical protein